MYSPKSLALIVLVTAGLITAAPVGYVSAGHNGALVTEDVGVCSPTTFSATVTDPDATHLVGSMRLVVDADGDVYFTNIIPTDGSAVSISVGPFGQDTSVSWRVFGGGERDYDQPLWNGHGGQTFNDDINAYGSENGFGFVVAGTDDPNPFTTWNEVDVSGCFPEVKDDCKNGGWKDFGFKNQGQCIRFVNTGQDSR